LFGLVIPVPFAGGADDAQEKSRYNLFNSTPKELTENVQIDCGCNVGVTSAADDINTFSSISVRF
jgi:hypothetical protein